VALCSGSALVITGKVDVRPRYLNQAPRPTQPPTLSGTGNDYWRKGGDAVRQAWLIALVDAHVGGN